MEPYDKTKACPSCGLTFAFSSGICEHCGHGKPEEKLEKKSSNFFDNIPAYCLVGMIFLGFAIFGYQCLLWLSDGSWTPLSPMIVLDKMDCHDIQQWANSGGWLGLKKIVLLALNLPLSMFCVFTSFVVVFFVE